MKDTFNGRVKHIIVSVRYKMYNMRVGAPGEEMMRIVWSGMQMLRTFSRVGSRCLEPFKFRGVQKLVSYFDVLFKLQAQRHWCEVLRHCDAVCDSSIRAQREFGCNTMIIGST